MHDSWAQMVMCLKQACMWSSIFTSCAICTNESFRKNTNSARVTLTTPKGKQDIYYREVIGLFFFCERRKTMTFAVFQMQREKITSQFPTDSNIFSAHSNCRRSRQYMIGPRQRLGPKGPTVIQSQHCRIYKP